MDDAGAAAFIEAMARAPIGVRGEWFQIAVADSATDALVGDIGFRLDDDRAGVAEIGFSMAPAAQGRGLGTEAVQGALAMLFDSATVDVVEGITDARNAFDPAARAHRNAPGARTGSHVQGRAVHRARLPHLTTSVGGNRKVHREKSELSVAPCATHYHQ